MMRIWRTNWLVVMGIALHLSWGVILLFSDAPLKTTPLGAFFLRDHYAAAVWFLSIAAVAAVGHRIRSGGSRASMMLPAVLLAPQQFSLMASAGTAVWCVVQGHYFDMEPRPRMFILSDQLVIILTMICHTAALIDWCSFSRHASCAEHLR